MDLTGKVALVTGAGQGLGWGVANALALAGARVAVNDIDHDLTAASVAHIEAAGGTALAAPFDVADARAFQSAVASAVERWGRIDVVVHAAIYMPLVTFEALDEREWKRQLDVGIGGLFNAAKAVWPAMLRQGGGHVIAVASGSSLRGYTEEVAYCTIKHGVEGFVKALALEAEARGIAINSMGPGAPIKPTRMSWDELNALPPDAKASWADPVELGRAFVWLASQPPASFSGVRFDAGPIVATLEREGASFAFEPEKVTSYPEDFRQRLTWRAQYPHDESTDRPTGTPSQQEAP